MRQLGKYNFEVQNIILIISNGQIFSLYNLFNPRTMPQSIDKILDLAV